MFGVFLFAGGASTLALALVPVTGWQVILGLIFVGLLSYMVANTFYDALLADVATRANRHG